MDNEACWTTKVPTLTPAEIKFFSTFSHQDLTKTYSVNTESNFFSVLLAESSTTNLQRAAGAELKKHSTPNPQEEDE